jgi:hypothetical protein
MSKEKINQYENPDQDMDFQNKATSIQTTRQIKIFEIIVL